jgi:molybdenum cofactor biosynthesis enzyme
MIYGFEEIGPDLPRPPLAARRALLGSGVAVPLETWSTMPLPARQAIVQEGAKDAVGEFVVKNAISSVLKRVRFMGPVKDPPLDSIPLVVVEALRAIHPMTIGEWQNLRPLDRYTLVAISSNSRLMYRAIEEMTTGPGSTLSSIKLRPWVGLLAHAEVSMTRVALGDVAGGLVKGGKAIVLARTAGVRAARSAHEVLDGYAEKYAGPVEIDARLDMASGGYVWQAHVSTAAGEFFAAASLLAAVTAAVALRDSIASKDPTASIANVALRDEAWSVGSGAFGDEATVAMSAKAYFTPGRSQPNVADDDEASPVPQRTRGVPLWIALLLVLSTLVAFAAAGMTIYKNGGLKRVFSSLR